MAVTRESISKAISAAGSARINIEDCEPANPDVKFSVEPAGAFGIANFHLRFIDDFTFTITNKDKAMPIYGSIKVFQRSTGLYLDNCVIEIKKGRTIFFANAREFEDHIDIPIQDIEIHYFQ